MGPLTTDQLSMPADPANLAPEAPQKSRIRRLVALLLLVGVVAASIWLFGTEAGRKHLDRAYLQQLGESARLWMNDNPLVTLGGFVLAYVVCAVFLLPVWWLQMLAGFTFGIWPGLAAVMVASTTGALVTASVSRWLGEDWVHRKIVGKGKAAKRLRKVMELAGRNGLLVVLISRLSYPVPYGVSNYLFGLLEIRRWHISLGTALGGTPVYAGWVAAGARPDWLGYWQFWVITIGVNLSLLIPLVVRSRRKPDVAASSGSEVADDPTRPSETSSQA